MKQLCVFLVYILTPFILIAQPAGGSGSWNLVFEDHFNGTSLDSTKWSKGYPWGSGNTHNHEAFCVPENVTVENGLLRIKAEATKYPGSPEGFDWTSGVVTTSGKFHISAGFIEGRFKAPATLGTWPAFWTLGNGWPPEIDIMEIPHARNVHHYYLHYGPDWQNEQSFGGTHTGPDKSAGFHTYGVEWDTNYMYFYFDGQRVATFNNRPEVAQAVDQYLLINLAVGGWAGAPPAGAQFPCYFESDWVRVWKKVPAEPIQSGLYRITPSHATNRAIETANQGTTNGTNVQQWSYWGGSNQHWYITDLENGYYSIRLGSASGPSLDIADQSTANGANVALYSYWGGNNQQFQIVQNGNGFNIKPRNSDKCLDIASVATTNGANLQQWDCTGGANQTFTFTSISSQNLTSAKNDHDQVALFFSESDAGLMVYPNPFNVGDLNVQTQLPFDSEVNIIIYNTLGLNVYSKNLGFHRSGPLNKSLKLDEISDGAYVLVLESGGEIQKTLFIKQSGN